MKTMEELYQEVLGSDELKGAFAQAVSEGRIEEFLKENGLEPIDWQIENIHRP